jgi:hypothetical protein
LTCARCFIDLIQIIYEVFLDFVSGASSLLSLSLSLLSDAAKLGGKGMSKSNFKVK